MDLKSELEKIDISENCFLKVYINCDEQSYVLELNYLEGKFKAEKTFPNNIDGVAYMEEVKSLYRNENDIKRYFGII